MFDEDNADSSAQIIGKLLKIDATVLQKLATHADAVVERNKKSAYREMEVEEGNPVVPNPWILLKNTFRAAVNLWVSSYQPSHILYPTYHEAAWGRDGMPCNLPVRTRTSISPEMAEAAVFYVERNKAEIMDKAGITDKELRELRIFARKAGMGVGQSMAVHP